MFEALSEQMTPSQRSAFSRDAAKSLTTEGQAAELTVGRRAVGALNDAPVDSRLNSGGSGPERTRPGLSAGPRPGTYPAGPGRNVQG